jgi:ribosomal protein L40E
MDTDYSNSTDDTMVAVIAFVFVAVIVVFYIWRELEKSRRRKEAERLQFEADERIPFCPRCKLKQDLGSQFCRQCGSKDLTTWAYFKLSNPFAQLEMALAPVAKALKPVVTATREHVDKERWFKTRELYDSLTQCRYCNKCHNEFPPDGHYCGNCGVPTIPFSRDLVFKWLQNEKPDIVITEADFEYVEKMGSPFLGRKGRFAFDVTKFIAKKVGGATFHLAKNVTKHAIKSAFDKGHHSYTADVEPLTSPLKANTRITVPPPPKLPPFMLEKKKSDTQPIEFKFNCPNCDQHILVPLTFAGSHVTCPGCGSDIEVPIF